MNANIKVVVLFVCTLSATAILLKSKSNQKGQCPLGFQRATQRLKYPHFPLCFKECKNDEDCGNNLLCCEPVTKNHCNKCLERRTRRKLLTTEATTTTTKITTTLKKTGNCPLFPVANPIGGVGETDLGSGPCSSHPCALDECQTNENCPGLKLCCYSGGIPGLPFKCIDPWVNPIGK